MTETYESLRNQAPSQAGELWKLADSQECAFRAYCRDLKEDPRYSREHKYELAHERYEADNVKIAPNKAKARELYEKQALPAERLSFPLPDGEALITNDTQKLLATQKASLAG
jgi:hypothetical protein